MREKPISPQKNLFDQHPIAEQINLQHPLVRLNNLIDWDDIESYCSQFFPSKTGRTATPSRLVAGLLYLQHISGLSDEPVVWAWVENIYWQYFTGETYLQTKPPIDPSSLTRWRKRLGIEGVEKLLQITINAGFKSGFLTPKQCETVLVDTTVMPYPTDGRLLEKARQSLVKMANEEGIFLRQNYNEVGPKLLLQIGRYAHEKQYKRMKGSLKKLLNIVGRIKRDIGRKLQWRQSSKTSKISALLAKAQKAIEQMPNSKNKLYAWHAPEVECIAKGKVRTPYEFSVKVSLATTEKTGFALCSSVMHGAPYDGHTLEAMIQKSVVMSGVEIKRAVVDRGYKGAEVKNVTIFRSGQKRGVSKALKTLIKRRSCIEGSIGHMKTDGKLGRNPLKGKLGDCIHAVLCGCSHNLRLLLRYLERFFAKLFSWFVGLFDFLAANNFRPPLPVGW